MIHVSNFRPVKRIDAVMQVFARIAGQVKARLLLVGDGPEVSTAHRLARELGVADRTQWLGAQELVIPLLSAADVFLLPSAQESFGLAALEAMACEVPVVASNVGGLPEVIEHGVTGFLHPPDDLDGMAASAVAAAAGSRPAPAGAAGGGGPRAPRILRRTRRTGLRSGLCQGDRGRRAVLRRDAAECQLAVPTV